MALTQGAFAKAPETERVFDVLGIGLGPANLALAAAFDDDRRRREEEDLSAVFLEARDQFVWHQDLLLPEGRCQVSFLKDLATFRDPCSPYTFLNYLYSQGRLSHFANLGDMTPSRVEYNDYFRWAADRLQSMIRYRQKVAAVHPVSNDDGLVEALRVVAYDPATEDQCTYLTRNLVMATGAVPAIPPGVDLKRGGRIFHSSEFLSRIRHACPEREASYKIVVVGSSQSAADITNYLLDEYPNVRVTVAMRQFAFRPLDDSPFVNELFDPEMIETVYEMPSEVRAKLLRDHRNAAYSIVDANLLERLYARLYKDRVHGRERAKILRLHQFVGAREDSSSAHIHFLDSSKGEETALEADAMVLCTGYSRRRRLPLLDPVERFLESAEDGEYVLDRDYRIKSTPQFCPQIIVQGFAEGSHGISDAQLSNIAHRAGRIQQHLRGHSRKARSTACAQSFR